MTTKPASRLSLSTKRLLRVKELLQNYGPRAAIQMSIVVANFGFIQTVARLLPTAEFGRYSLMLAFNMLAFSCLFQPINDGVMRFLHGATRDGQRTQIRRSIARFGLGACILACVLYIVLLCVAALFHAELLIATTELIIATPFFFVLYCLVATITSYFNSDARYLWYVFTGLGAPVLGAITAIIAVHYLRADALSVVFAQLAIYTTLLVVVGSTRVNSVSELGATLFCEPDAHQKASDRQFFSYVLPMPVLYLANYAAVFGDRWLVASFFSLQDLGRFSYLYVLTTNVVFAIYNVYSATTFLHVVEQFNNAQLLTEKKNVLRRFFVMCAAIPLLFVPLLPVYVMFEGQIVHIVFGTRADVPGGSLAVVLVSAALLCGAMQLSMVANLLKRQHELIVPRWAAVLLILCVVIAYHPSLVAVCWELMIVNAVFYGVMVAIVWRMVGSLRDVVVQATTSSFRG